MRKDDNLTSILLSDHVAYEVYKKWPHALQGARIKGITPLQKLAHIISILLS